MAVAKHRLFADNRGVWQDGESGRTFGITWDEVYCVSGHILDGVTETYACVVLDWDYGEYFELYHNSPGFKQVVAAITERLPGIAPGWYEQIESLRIGDAPIEVWRRV